MSTLTKSSFYEEESLSSPISSAQMNQLLIILKGMKEEMNQLRATKDSSVTNLEHKLQTVEECVLSLQQSLIASSDDWKLILMLTKDIRKSLSDGGVVQVSSDRSFSYFSNTVQKVDRLISLISDTSKPLLSQSNIHGNSDEVNSLREELANQSKQLSLLIAENKDLRSQLNVVLQNQTQLFHYLKQILSLRSDSNLEFDCISDGSLIVPLSTTSTQHPVSLKSSRSLPRQAELFQKYRLILLEWLTTTPKGDWVCCYRGSEHGWSAHDFHSHCDDAGSLLILIRSTAEAVFGAYTQVGFQSSYSDCSFIHDDNSFMFVLESPFMDDCPKKFDAIPGVAGIIYNLDYGAIFGNESEECLVISNECTIKGSHTYYFPCAYKASNLNNLSINGDPYFLVDELEVYYKQ